MIPIRVRLMRALPYLIILGIGVWLWRESSGFALLRPGYVGPEVWPRAVLILLIASAVVGALQALVRGIDDDAASALIKSATRVVGRDGEVEADLQIDAGDPSTRRPVWAVVGIALLLGFVAAVPYLGFAPTTFFVMFGFILAAGYPRPLIAATVAAVGTLAFFFIFQRIAYVSLPLGVGPFKELSTTLMAVFGVR